MNSEQPSLAFALPPDIRGLVFDCDGTIADTMPLHYQAWCETLREHGRELPEAMFYEMAGIPTPRIVQLLNERHGWTLPVEQTSRRKEELFLKLLPQVMPIEPVVQVIRHFAGRLPMAVATGGTRAVCRKTLSFMGLIDYFQAIVTADDVAQGKPAPDIFLEAARRLGVPPQTCAAFEDGDLGIQAARAAGMFVFDVRDVCRRPSPSPTAGLTPPAGT